MGRRFESDQVHLFLCFPLSSQERGFCRDDEIGIHRWFKPICCKACGFDSRSRHYLLYGVIGNTTDFGSVIGESYSSRATLYNNVRAYIIYIYLQFIKKNSIIARRNGESLDTPHIPLFPGVLPSYYTPLGPKNSGRKFRNLYPGQNCI